MKQAIDRKESKRTEDAQPETLPAGKAAIKLLVWRELTVVIREPEPPRFIERTSDVGHWGINE